MPKIKKGKSKPVSKLKQDAKPKKGSDDMMDKGMKKKMSKMMKRY